MKKLTIFVVPSDAVGHIQACIGTTRTLLTRGHRIIFLTENAFKGLLIQEGYEEFNYQHIFIDESSNNNNDQKQLKPGERMARDLFEQKVIGPVSIEEQLESMPKYIHESSTAKAKLFSRDRAIKEAIALYQPNVILVDKNYLEPAIKYSNIPIIWNCSFAPQLYIEDDSLPPGCTGLASHPANDEEKERWIKIRKSVKEFLYNRTYNENIVQMGYPKYEDITQVNPSKHSILNVYAYPEELNYQQIRSNPNWFNLEVFNKIPLKSKLKLNEILPADFIDNQLNGKFNGKYIYLSLGSMASVDIDLMKRLISILSKLEQYKIIVSKGPRHNEYNLPDTYQMYGQRFLPQQKLLPFIDLFIGHGGNNSFTEGFSLGKPMIIMPLLGDQLDNAQRLHESGLGIRLNPYEFKDQELLDSIEYLLNNQELQHKLQQAAVRIQSSQAHELLADKIENLLLK